MRDYDNLLSKEIIGKINIKIDEYNQPIQLPPSLRFTNSKIHIIINQLVSIWYHMYRHKYIHNDIWLHHIYVSNETVVSLIDFQWKTRTAFFFH